VKEAARLGVGDEVLARIKADTLKYIGDHELHFRVLRNTFFFMDQFPENATRFDLTLEKCLAESEPT
jgi:hypothetical protein